MGQELQDWLNESRRCILHSLGIIFFLLIYGALQERIMTRPYHGQVFNSSLFLVLCNRILAVLCSLTAIIWRGERLQSEAPYWQYASVALSNVGATACQYEALKYVSFVVQMLGKSFKMLPVMIWSISISGAHFGAADWLVALLVTLGVSEFLLLGPTASSQRTDNGTAGWGYALILAFLVFDGFTSSLQEKLFKEHRTSRCNQMLYVNLFSTVISSLLLIVSGQAGSSAGFLFDHHDFAIDTAALSGAAVASQYFIYAQVQDFGAVTMAATMNVRQVCSIIGSYALYGHSITQLQMTGLGLVFSALIYKAFVNYKETPSSAEKAAICQAPEDALEKVQGGGV